MEITGTCGWNLWIDRFEEAGMCNVLIKNFMNVVCFKYKNIHWGDLQFPRLAAIAPKIKAVQLYWPSLHRPFEMLLCIMHLILANSCLTGMIFYYIERAIVVKFTTDRSDYEYILKKYKLVQLQVLHTQSVSCTRRALGPQH